MAAKSFSNLLKVATVLAWARETLEVLAKKQQVDPKTPNVKFSVTEKDVNASWDIIKQSMRVYKCFKVNLIAFFGVVSYSFT